MGVWYEDQPAGESESERPDAGVAPRSDRRGKVAISLAILMALMFSKYFYLASLKSYYTFYLINKFHSRCRARRCICSCFWARWRRGRLSAARSATGSGASM